MRCPSRGGIEGLRGIQIQYNTSRLPGQGLCSDLVPSHFPPIVWPLEEGFGALLERGLWSAKTFGLSQKVLMLFKAEARWWFCCWQTCTLDFSCTLRKGWIPHKTLLSASCWLHGCRYTAIISLIFLDAAALCHILPVKGQTSGPRCPFGKCTVCPPRMHCNGGRNILRYERDPNLAETFIHPGLYPGVWCCAARRPELVHGRVATYMGWLLETWLEISVVTLAWKN